MSSEKPKQPKNGAYIRLSDNASCAHQLSDNALRTHRLSDSESRAQRLSLPQAGVLFFENAS